MSSAALSLVAPRLSSEDKLALLCALLPPEIICFRSWPNPDPNPSVVDVIGLYACPSPAHRPLMDVIEGLGGEMIERRQVLAKVELSRVVYALYGMLERVWEGCSSPSASDLIVTHCGMIVLSLESVAQAEAAVLKEGDADASDEEDIFEELDRRRDRLYVYTQAARLATRYLRALRNAVFFRKIVWLRSLVRMHMWKFLDAMWWVLAGENAFDVTNRFEELCDELCVQALKEAYMEPHETLHWVTASAIAGAASGIMYTGFDCFHVVSAYQAGLLCQGLTVCIAGAKMAFSIEFPPYSQMPVSNKAFLFRGFKDLCVRRMSTSPLVSEFWKEAQKSRPAVTVTKAGKVYRGGCCVNYIGERIDIRSYCEVDGAVVPLCIVTIEAMAGMFEIRAGFLMFQGGQSVLKAMLCRLPARELSLL